MTGGFVGAVDKGNGNGMYGIVVLLTVNDSVSVESVGVAEMEHFLKLKGGGGTVCLETKDCATQHQGTQDLQKVVEATVFTWSKTASRCLLLHQFLYGTLNQQRLRDGCLPNAP